jgi:hypothetical protein
MLPALERYGLAPALLTAIDSEQALTLNYDRLFETAPEDAGAPRSVIPGGHEGEHERWLLKVHGTVDDPASIVLTRDDYLGFDSSRLALSSIVKATLATRHLLFVGFGLADDHFHEIPSTSASGKGGSGSCPGCRSRTTVLVWRKLLGSSRSSSMP